MARILVIEPDRLLSITYKAAFENAGYKVQLASGAQSAITSADKQWPDLVLLELQLITHSGIEFLYEFRSYLDWQAIPVIVHSEVPFSEFADSWNLMRDELGVRKYMYKPQTTLRQLQRSVDEFVTINS